jgi:DNA repair protein RecO (recombination protein O)
MSSARHLATDALILRRIDTGEADRIVWLLTPDRGRLSAFAAGARASRRRFGGALESFTHLSVELTPPQRGELWRLVDAQILDAHASLRESLNAMACASAASELMAALAVEGGAHRGHSGHYEVLLAYLRALAHRPMVASDLYRFLLLALETSGVRPMLTKCARCGRSEATPAEHFDPSEGGRLCGECRPRAPGVRPLASPLLQALRSFEAGQAECSSEARALLWDYTQHHLGKPIKSLGLLRELGL